MSTKNANKVKAERQNKVIPTYVPGEAIKLPLFLEHRPYQGASGRLYPLPYTDSISDEKKDVSYDVFTLENEYVKTEILPELGGKILSGYDKISDYDFIYRNEVVKPALVGLAGPWISGGIEFNWPQHHRPTTFMPVESYLEEDPDGSKTVWVGETDPFYHMKGEAGITVEPGRSYIKAKVRIYNPTPERQIFMWWANIAVPVNDSYRTIFPPDVEWVNDHDRRCVLSWPEAKGVYRTARPFDYGEGTDVSRYSSVKVPSSFLVAQGQSDMDFVAGYDGGKRAGIVTVADHHIAPGKKMWTWGKGDFGRMWCSNLTDENGPYIELMAGAFTDNQPDFTFIAPYETKEFEQFWYPIRDIGDVKNASKDAAVNLERRGDSLFIGFNVTGTFKNAAVTVKCGEKTVFSDIADLDPSSSYVKEIPMGDMDINDVSASLSSSDGAALVSYKTYVRGNKKPIEPRKPVKRPREIASNEELFINGLHLEQYKQHNYDARDYYLEALSRDGGDSRCNTAMARISFKNGDFEGCVSYADRAIERLTMRNTHPIDTEALYLKGMAKKYLGDFASARDALFTASWDRSQRCAALFALSQIDCAEKKFSDALAKLDECLTLDVKNNAARLLKAAIYRNTGRLSEAKKEAEAVLDTDKLDIGARIELACFGYDKNAVRDMFGKKPENHIGAAVFYENAGLYRDALFALAISTDEYPLFEYHRAYCLEKLGDLSAAKKALEKAESMDEGYCFPSRIDDIAVLSRAAAILPDGKKARYYLGCLYYDRFSYGKAASLWEEAVKIDPRYAKALRNLAFFYFDKAKKPGKALACMEKAISAMPDEPRLLMEYQQLLKNTNASLEKRLAVYEKYRSLLSKRDDCYLDMITLVCLSGKYGEAIEMAKKRRFHIYEGGEGKLTKLHAWMHVLLANELTEKGEYEKARDALINGTRIPASYGEAKTFFNQEAHVYWLLGLICEKTGESAAANYEKAAEYKAAVSEVSLFRALALKKLGKYAEADLVLSEMEDKAADLIKNRDLRTYYGVGSPSPLPFEDDVEKNNLLEGYVLYSYALSGRGDKAGSEKYAAAAREIAPCDLRIYALEKIRGALDCQPGDIPK